jgi:UDP-glucose 4-epimerase
LANGAILVTGGAGYIGSHVVRQLGEAGEQIVVIDNLSKGFRQAVTAGDLIVGDVGDFELVSRLLAEHQVDTVMHFAAHTVVPESVALPLKYYGNNTCATRNLLQACIENEVKNFVFSSTAAVYGMPQDGYASEDSPTLPINAYGTSKLMSEWMLRDVAAVNPLRYVALRYFNVYGPRMDIESRYTEVLVRWMERIGAGLAPIIFGEGSETMDFVYVSDIARANVLAALSPVSGEVFNVATGVETSLRSLASMLLAAMGSNLQPQFAPQRTVNSASRKSGDPTKARAMLGFETEVDLEEGLKRLVSWWRTARPAPQVSPALTSERAGS